MCWPWCPGIKFHFRFLSYCPGTPWREDPNSLCSTHHPRDYVTLITCSSSPLPLQVTLDLASKGHLQRLSVTTSTLNHSARCFPLPKDRDSELQGLPLSASCIPQNTGSCRNRSHAISPSGSLSSHLSQMWLLCSWPKPTFFKSPTEAALPFPKEPSPFRIHSPGSAAHPAAPPWATRLGCQLETLSHLKHSLPP